MSLCLLDALETADMLLIDDLHAWQFQLNEVLLDQADVAAQAEQAFASTEWLLQVESLDGRTRRIWRFTYNEVMEACHQPEEDAWQLYQGEQVHRLRCLAAFTASTEEI